ncbi:flagellar hook-associated protein FlgL [Gorillibacterium sp. sgz5001074]|uniref:flagellar hook-associated protein FlgL n=1 Tax=Gorillibacterium sp. sgz5001074 TaxID=3446695 RepID=UPI003F66FDE8
MMGRITQNMLNTQMLRNLGSNLTRMSTMQEQLSTNRRINRPSDDPVGLSFAMRYRSELSANEQHQENVDSATSWLEFTDTMLDQAGKVFNRIRELSVQGANGSNSKDAMNAIKSEIDQLYSQLVTIGNTDFNGKRIFNGQKTDVKPYEEATAEEAETDDAPIKFDIGFGTTLAVNITGSKVFGEKDATDNAFALLKELSTNLDANDHTAISNMLGRLDSRIGTFLEVRADIGAKLNRIELAQDRLKDSEMNLTTLQTKVEDADVAEVITNLKTSENVYQSSLSVGANLIKPSLIDFLR